MQRVDTVSRHFAQPESKSIASNILLERWVKREANIGHSEVRDSIFCRGFILKYFNLLRRTLLLALGLALFVAADARAAGVDFNTRTAHSGSWSDPATWENGKPPQAGDRVQVRPGHDVVYDVAPEK